MTEDDNNADDLMCPISYRLMTECAATPCNHRFHRKALFVWVCKHGTCPMDRLPVRPEAIVRDADTEVAAQAWLARQSSVEEGTLFDLEAYVDLERSREKHGTEVMERMVSAELNDFSDATEAVKNGADLTPEAKADAFGDLFVAFANTVAAKMLQEAVDPRIVRDLMEGLVQTFQYSSGMRAAVLVPDQDEIPAEYRSHTELMAMLYLAKEVYEVPIEDYAKYDSELVCMNKMCLVYGRSTKISFVRDEQKIVPWRDTLHIDGLASDMHFNDVLQWIVVVEFGADYLVLSRDHGCDIDEIRIVSKNKSTDGGGEGWVSKVWATCH